MLTALRLELRVAKETTNDRSVDSFRRGSETNQRFACRLLELEVSYNAIAPAGLRQIHSLDRNQGRALLQAVEFAMRRKRTRRYSIEVKDTNTANAVIFTVADWTDDERRAALAQILRMMGLPDTDCFTVAAKLEGL